jgi:hypothetical protein
MGSATSQPIQPIQANTLTIVISENQDYDTGVLTDNALIDYRLSIVNNGLKQYLIHASSGTTTLSKLNTKLSKLTQPTNLNNHDNPASTTSFTENRLLTNDQHTSINSQPSIQVELDLYVNSGGEKIHFATISEDSELAKSFFNNVGEEYPYTFTTWNNGIRQINEDDTVTLTGEGPINPVNIYLIDEATMKAAIVNSGGEDWEDQQINIIDVQDRVSELEGIIKSSQFKLQSYKKSSSDLAYKGLDIEQAEIDFADNGVPMSVEKLYSLYTKLSTYTILTGDARTKSSLITNIYKNYTTLIDMMGGAKDEGNSVPVEAL